MEEQPTNKKNILAKHISDKNFHEERELSKQGPV